MICRDNHNNWICTLDAGHDGPHVDRSLVDGFVYLTWPNVEPPLLVLLDAHLLLRPPA